MYTRNRITVNFRDNKEDTELYNYILEKGKIINNSNAIKQIIQQHKELEEKESEGVK